MAKYRLLSGKYRDRQGNDFVPGQIVTSQANLVRIFPNHFELVETKPAPVVDAPETKPADAPTAPQVAPEPTKAADDQPVESPGEAAPAAATAVPDRGIPSTSDFPAALQAGFEVFRRGGYYFVYRPDSPEAVNEKGLRTPQVEAFIGDLLSEEE